MNMFLDKHDPYSTAKLFIRWAYGSSLEFDFMPLRYVPSEQAWYFLEPDLLQFELTFEPDIRAEVWEFLADRYYYNRHGEKVDFKPKRKDVAEVMAALKACTHAARKPEFVQPRNSVASAS